MWKLRIIIGGPRGPLLPPFAPFPRSTTLDPCRSRALMIVQSDYRINVSVWAGALSAAVSRGSAPLVVGACRRGNTRLTAVIGGLVLALASLFTSFALQMHQVLLRCVATRKRYTQVLIAREMPENNRCINTRVSIFLLLIFHVHVSEKDKYQIRVLYSCTCYWKFIFTMKNPRKSNLIRMSFIIFKIMFSVTNSIISLKRKECCYSAQNPRILVRTDISSKYEI